MGNIQLELDSDEAMTFCKNILAKVNSDKACYALAILTGEILLKTTEEEEDLEGQENALRYLEESIIPLLLKVAKLRSTCVQFSMNKPYKRTYMRAGDPEPTLTPVGAVHTTLKVSYSINEYDRLEEENDS